MMVTGGVVFLLLGWQAHNWKVKRLDCSLERAGW